MDTDKLIALVTAQVGALADSYESGASASDLYEAALLAVAIESIQTAGATSPADQRRSEPFSRIQPPAFTWLPLDIGFHLRSRLIPRNEQDV